MSTPTTPAASLPGTDSSPIGVATEENFRALFEPRGVIVAGASSHPGKFGFSALHNILASGYKGNVFATNREAEIILGVQTLGHVKHNGEQALKVTFCIVQASDVAAAPQN